MLDGNSSWREVLAAYVREMNLWVGAVRMGGSLAEVIPVAAAPTRENAEALASRLAYIQTEMLAADAEAIDSDT